MKECEDDCDMGRIEFANDQKVWTELSNEAGAYGRAEDVKLRDGRRNEGGERRSEDEKRMDRYGGLRCCIECRM